MRRIVVCLTGVLILMGLSVAQADFFDIWTEVSTDSVHYPVSGNPAIQVNAKQVTSPTLQEKIQYSFGPTTSGITAMRAVNRDDGSPVAMAPDSFFDVFLESFSSSHLRIDSFFDVFCSDGSKGQVGNVTVNYFAPDSFFDVFLEMNVPTAGGNQTIHIHGDLNTNQPARFGTGSISATTGLYNIDSFFDIFTEIYSTNDTAGPFTGYNYNQPLMTLKMEITPEPATLLVLALGGLAALRRKKP